jgi:Flp pilus assembly protein TadG
LALGVAEYGRALYQYNTLVKTVRDAARLLSQHNPLDAVSYSLAVNDARCLAVHGNTGCTGPSLVSGLTSAMA